jgi:6-phosphogluconolactonase
VRVGLEVEVLPDARAVAERGTSHVTAHAEAAIAERGGFSFAVSGGRTPWAMLTALADELPWEHVTIYQVDERIAPDGHPDRNLTHLLDSLPPGCPIDVRAMPVTARDLAAAARDYSVGLPERLDLVHLGLGADGHTASLVPNDPVLEVADRDVAVTREYQGRRRMTLTYPAIDRARRILWLVTGAEKADALRRLLAGDPTIPAARVRSDEALVLTDEGAYRASSGLG